MSSRSELAAELERFGANIRRERNARNLTQEKLAELATAEAREKLHQALDAHEKKLADMQQQHKTGRNALVLAQKKRIRFIQELIQGEKEESLLPALS